LKAIALYCERGLKKDIKGYIKGVREANK
jgi:hypothetical protein